MRRVFATLLYYFCWQRILAWTTGIGLALVVVGGLIPPRFGFLPVGFGSVLFAGFPIVFAGIAFREVISNQRFAMVPEFRSYAAAGLLLLALLGSGMTLVFANAIWADIMIVEPLRVVLFAFFAISAFLLMSQWLVIYSLGLIGFVLLPLVALRLWMFSGPLAGTVLAEPWLLATLAALGWVWLIVATRRRSVPRPLAAPAWENGRVPDLQGSRGHNQWLPRWGSPASALGTVLRAMPDGVGNRTAFFLMAMLMFPVAMWLVLYLLGAPLADSQRGPFGMGFFLVWSLFGLTTQASAVNREWPARLRYLWLRASGDRAAGWQLLERSLATDLLIVAGLATVMALLFGLISAVDSRYLGLYVAGCVVVTAFASYVGFWTRAANWHALVDAFFWVFIGLTCFGIVAFANGGEKLVRLNWILAVMGALTVVARGLAKRRLALVDWCATRPAQMRRRNA
jgi:hypothetical protein